MATFSEHESASRAASGPPGVPAPAALRQALHPADPALVAAGARLQRRPLRARLPGQAPARQRGAAARRPVRRSESQRLAAEDRALGQARAEAPRGAAGAGSALQPGAHHARAADPRQLLPDRAGRGGGGLRDAALHVHPRLPGRVGAGQHHGRHEARRLLQAARASAALPPGPPPRGRPHAHHAGRGRRARRALAGLRRAGPAGGDDLRGASHPLLHLVAARAGLAGAGADADRGDLDLRPPDPGERQAPPGEVRGRDAAPARDPLRDQGDQGLPRRVAGGPRLPQGDPAPVHALDAGGQVPGLRPQPGRDAEQRDGGGDARAGGAAGAARPLRAHGRRRRRLRHRPHHHLQAGQGDRQGLGQADGRAAVGRALLRGDGHADRGEGRAGRRAGGSAPAGRDARGRLLLLRPRAGARTRLASRRTRARWWRSWAAPAPARPR